MKLLPKRKATQHLKSNLMKVLFYFGPDKLPFKLTESGMVKPNSAMPFHGIISRGLLKRFIAKNIKAEVWYQYAHLSIDDNSNVTNPNLEKLRDEILASKVLSFAQSALCVKKYVEQTFGIEFKDVRIVLWNIKEGHTSSVWKASIISEEKKEIFVVNVARDYDSGIELKETSENLLVIGNTYLEINLAKVLEISSIKHDLLPFEVIVTKNDWIENSFEIHKRTNRESGNEELLVVERFLTDPNNRSKIRSVVGKVISQKETEQINDDINQFLTTAANCLSQTLLLNINDGDVVWDGKKATVVAIS